MNQQKFKVVVFKNNKKKKVVKSFVTKQRALSYYNDLLYKNSLVKFNKEFENGKRCSYMIGLIFEELNSNSKFFFIDKFGRNVSITSSDFEIIKLNDYLSEDFLFDIKKNKKISYDEFYNSIINKKELTLISKLNNKIITQNNDLIELFSLKNEEDSERIIDILSNEKQKPYLISVDFSIEQRKYLYKLLEDYGFNKKMLYRKTTTHPRE
jgi:hypothetical protein